MKKLVFTLTTLCYLLSAQGQTARVQVIHNCADAIADSVDVYLNGTLLLDNFAFRTATPYTTVTAGTPITIAIAPKNSTGVADSIYSLTTTLTSNATYVAVANGIVSGMGYSPSPDFGLDIYAMGRESATSGSNTDLLVMHGSTDAPTVDVRSGIETLVDDVSYGSFSSGYLELPTSDYKVRLTNTTGSATVQTYSAPLSTLSLNGGAGVVVASGFLNPANNSNGPAFGLYVALPTGGDLVMLPTADAEALSRVQVIHNSADAAAAQVDVYVNGDLAIDDFAFRTATEFIDLPANTVLEIGVAPGNSTSVTDTIYNLTATLDSAETYVVIANGIVSTTGYTPAQDFRLSVYPGAREVANNSGNTDVLVMHGSTDAPTVDVRNNSNVLVNDISFGNYATNYLELPVADYIIDLTDAMGSTTIASYTAPLQTLNLSGVALSVLVSGFVNPSNNSNGPAFGLYAALPTGGALVQLPVFNSIASLGKVVKEMNIYPNPAADKVYFSTNFNDVKITVSDITGRVLYNSANFSGNSLDISGFSSGVYILTAESSQEVYLSKFTKQ